MSSPCAQDNTICTIEEFAQFSGIPLYFFYQWACEDDKERLHYHRVDIPRKSGRVRTLSIPSRALKQAQRVILAALAEHAPTASAAWAYRKGRCLRDHGELHSGAPLLMRADLVDFFGSITFSQVFWAIDQTLKASPLFGPHQPQNSGAATSPLYNSRLSWFLTRACTLNGCLPQGAPTSPMLSNAVMSPLDRRILGYCKKRGITYSRYADDLIFSGKSFNTHATAAFLRQLLAEYGFILNEKKSAVLGRGQQHRITGVVANGKPQAPAAYRKQIRQEMYYIGKYGLRDHLEKKGLLFPIAEAYRTAQGGKPAVPSDIPELVRYTQQLLGRIQFVLQINPSDKEFQEYKGECRLLLGQLPWALFN